MEILCFDSSISTSINGNYWKVVGNLAKSRKFDQMLRWDSICRPVLDASKPFDLGGTDPSTFMNYILKHYYKNYILGVYGKNAKLNLQITTDGQIDDYTIQRCAQYLLNDNFPPLNRVTIHYIGSEREMNFGLNAIFGSVAELYFTVNDINSSKKVPTVQELEEYDDIFSPEYISFLCSRVTDLKANDFAGFDRLRKKIIAKIEKKHKEANKPIQPRKYFKKNDGAGLEKAIKDRLFGVDQTEYQAQKNKILACFDKISNITLADIRGKSDLKTNVLTKPNVVEKYDLPEDVVVEVEDSITFENIDEGKVCVLVKFDQPPLLKCDSKYVKNPFLIFQDDAMRDKLIKRFELHPFSIESVKKITQGNDTTSPFTRDICRAFILGPSNMNEVNFNSIALATFFKSDKRNKIYGDKLIWNFVMLYLIKSHIDSKVKNDESVAWPRDELHPLVNAIIKEFVLNDTLLYRLTLHVTINLPVARVPLYIALWYIIKVAPFYATNSTRNVLRYPASTFLFTLFEDINLKDKIPLDDKIRKRLCFRMKVWRLWNEMLARRKDRELKLLTRASYQNYCMIEGKVVLLSGSRPKDLKAPELVDGIPPSIIQNMWDTLTPKSKRFDKINEDGNSLTPPKWKILRDDRREYTEVQHMRIDPETLRPTEICPITNRPASECAGRYDVKSESFARMFSLYCAKYKKYPDNADQLVLLHNRKRAIDNVSSRHIHKYLKHVFDIYQPFATTMWCSDFVEKYNAVGAAKSKPPEEAAKPRREPKKARSSDEKKRKEDWSDERKPKQGRSDEKKRREDRSDERKHKEDRSDGKKHRPGPSDEKRSKPGSSNEAKKKPGAQPWQRRSNFGKWRRPRRF